MTIHRFLVPDLGEGLSEVEIIEWLVAVGEVAKADQPLAVVQTDKAVVDVPAPVTGLLVERGGEEGTVLAVGAVLAVIDVLGEDDRSHESVAHHAAPDVPPDASADGSGSGTARVTASPATRQRARAAGIDLRAVVGSGPGGRIEPSDLDRVLTANPSASAPEPEPVPGATSTEDLVIPLRGLRRQIVASMTQSWNEIPHFAEFREVDATELVRAQQVLRDTLRAESVRFSLLPLVVRAVAVALRRHRSLNASIDVDAGTIVHRSRINIGIATSTDAGLIVPVVADADRLPVRRMAAEVDRLAQAARAQTIAPGELSGGTFTITNFGSFGTWLGTPIIRPPEVAILGFGRIRDTVVAVDGEPRVRPTLPIALSVDHRVNDGSHAAGFLDDVAALLIEPIRLLVDER